MQIQIIKQMNTVILLIITIPLIEIYLMIKIGGVIGAVNTIFLIFFTAITGLYFARLEGLNAIRSGFNQLVKNNLYGQECVLVAEEAKKAKFSEQLKLLQQNPVNEESLQGGELGGNQDYGDIFGDPNLFKDFGGFD